MRLCFVAPGYYPDPGGAEEYVRAMAERLARKGHEVHAVVPADKGMPPEERNGVNVHRLEGRAFFSKRLARLAGLEERLGEINPGLVHIQSHASLYALQAAEACQRLGKKFVVLTYGPTGEHNRNGFLRDLFVRALDAWTAPRIFPKAALVLYRTENLVPWCRRQGAKRLARAPTGLDEAFLEAPATEAKWEASQKKVVGFVGSLSARKGCRQLVQAFPEVLEREPDAVLVFVGGEGEKGFGRKLAVEAERLGISQAVLFVGRVGASPSEGTRKLIAWLDSFDVFCLPSSWEGPSQAMLQAMARGKPVVVARIPQLKGLMTEENGALIRFGDVGGLARALAELLGNPAKRKKAGDLNRQVAANYGFNRLAGELEKAYLQLI